MHAYVSICTCWWITCISAINAACMCEHMHMWVHYLHMCCMLVWAYIHVDIWPVREVRGRCFTTCCFWGRSPLTLKFTDLAWEAGQSPRMCLPMPHYTWVPESCDPILLLKSNNRKHGYWESKPKSSGHTVSTLLTLFLMFFLDYYSLTL